MPKVVKSHPFVHIRTLRPMILTKSPEIAMRYQSARNLHFKMISSPSELTDFGKFWLLVTIMQNIIASRTEIVKIDKKQDG